MRNIKFKIWDSQDQKFITAIDYQMALLSTMDKDPDYQEYIQTVDNGHGRFDMLQFTGLKDYNGTDIYEGDVLKGQDGDTGYVIYEGRSFELEPIGESCCDDCIHWAMNDIIGNIHEHPLLLEAD